MLFRDILITQVIAVINPLEVLANIKIILNIISKASTLVAAVFAIYCYLFVTLVGSNTSPRLFVWLATFLGNF